MKSLRRLLERGAEAGVFAGAVGLVRVRGRTVFRAAVGWAETEPGRRSMSLDTVFDLASLTKVLCTVPVVLRLCAQGVMELEAPLGRWLPAATHAPVRARDGARDTRAHGRARCLEGSVPGGAGAGGGGRGRGTTAPGRTTG